MAYWNRYEDSEDEEDRDFESGNRYNRGGFSRGPGQPRRDDFDRNRQWRNRAGGQDRDQDNLYDDYDAFGERYGQNWSTWSSEDRDWDYGYPRDYGQNRDVRRDYQSDREAYHQRGSRGENRPDWRRNNSSDPEDEPGRYPRERYPRDAYDRYNASGYNRDEEYYGLGYRPTNYNPHYPDRMPGRETPAAGMQSDFGGGADYDNPNAGRSNYRRGDVGYDSEGAFYQDMDEPENNEIWPFWETPGRHTGKGPANYRRSDTRIQEDVCERLTRHGRIDATDINVSVDNGVVILKGEVPTREMKRLAEDVADDVTGVRDVENEIKINRDRSWDQRGSASGRDRTSGRGGTSGRDRTSGRGYNNRDYDNRADYSPAGQSNVGAGLTSEGATSLQGMEAADEAEQSKHGLREGMEVIGPDGKLLGRVKEIREGDFLLDRELARDLYVPYSAIQSVGAQALLNVRNDALGNQGWEKPSIL